MAVSAARSGRGCNGEMLAFSLKCLRSLLGGVELMAKIADRLSVVDSKKSNAP